MKRSFIHTRVKLISRKWSRSRYLRSSTNLLLIAILIGIGGGIGAVLFHEALEWSKQQILINWAGMHFEGMPFQWSSIPHWWFFIVPALGGLISGLIVYGLAPETEGHGTDAMIESFHNKGGKVRTRVPFVKAVSSIITISSGGSAGYEGPTAQIGSGFGSIIARILKVPEKMGRLLLLAGTAAGLGAIFRAPLGGALTAVEVIYKEDFESEGFLPCIVASVVAYATFTQITHAAGAIFEIPGIAFTRPAELLFFAGLGVLCAGFSKLFVDAFYKSHNFFHNLNIPRPLKPALGGLGVGLVAYLCPNAVGGGWQYLQQALHGHYAIWMLLVIAVFKIITTSFTVGSGGSGGVFGPSLFIGGMLGGFYGFTADYFFPEWIDNPAAYVLVGMGAFFAGVANAPLASIVMVCEITGNYNLLAPLMLSSIIHVMLSRRWSIYKNQKLNKFESPVHKDELNTDVLQSIRISDIFRDTSSISYVKAHEDLAAVRKLLGETDSEVFPVLDDDGKITGLLGLNELRKVILETSAEHLVIVEDMMTPLYFLTPDMDLHRASQVFLRSKQSQLPILNQEHKVTGLLKYQDIIQAYDELVGA